MNTDRWTSEGPFQGHPKTYYTVRWHNQIYPALPYIPRQTAYDREISYTFAPRYVVFCINYKTRENCKLILNIHCQFYELFPVVITKSAIYHYLTFIITIFLVQQDELASGRVPAFREVNSPPLVDNRGLVFTPTLAVQRGEKLSNEDRWKKATGRGRIELMPFSSPYGASWYSDDSTDCSSPFNMIYCSFHFYFH